MGGRIKGPGYTLYQRGKTWWLWCHRDGQEVRRSLKTRDLHEAHLRAMGAVRAGLVRDSVRVEDLRTAYEAHSKARRAPKTHGTAIGYLRWALDEIGAVHPSALTTAAILDCLAHRAGTGAAPKTLNHIRSELRLFCAWLVDRGVLEFNPVDRVRTFHVPAPRITYLSQVQIPPMLTAATDLAPIASAILYAGLRRSEAVWLDVADVDMERGLLSIRAKGPWQPKTRRNRVVPISSKLRASLQLPGAGPLFRTVTGHRWNPDNLTHAYRARMDAASLPWTLLDLRHTFASHLIRKPGMTYARLAALMGNSPEICRRHYAHLATEEMGADVEF